MDLGSDYDMEAVGHTACGPFLTLGPLCPSTSETAEHACSLHPPAGSHPSLGVMEWAVQSQGPLPPSSAATERDYPWDSLLPSFPASYRAP